MISSMINIVRLLFRMSWPEILVWLMIQIAFISVVRDAMIARPFDRDTGTSASVVELCFIIGSVIGYGGLVIALGIVFNAKSRQSWLHRLPLHSGALTFVPLFILLSYGMVIHLLIPFGAFRTGISVCSLGIPIVALLTLKRSRNYVLGFIAASFASLAIYTVWIVIFYDWSSTQPVWRMELAYVAFFSILIFLIAGRERRYVWIAPAGLVILLAAEATVIQMRAPPSFEMAVLDLNFMETSKTREEFRRLALDPEFWDQPESYPRALPRYVNFLSQKFVSRYLSGAEKVRFFENLAKSFRQGQVLEFNSRWLNRWSLVWQPEHVKGLAYEFPISWQNADEELNSNLLKNWRDEEIYCFTLPFSRTAEYVEKMTQSSCGGRLLFGSPFWGRYSLVSPSEFEMAIDRLLLDKSLASTEVKRLLPLALFGNRWLTKEQRAPFQRELTDGSLSPGSLESLKDLLRSKEKAALGTYATLSRDAFVESLKRDEESLLLNKDGLNGGREDSETRLWYLCARLHENCWSPAYGEFNRERSLVESIELIWVKLWHGETASETRLLVQDLTSEERWPEIERLFQEVRAL